MTFPRRRCWRQQRNCALGVTISLMLACSARAGPRADGYEWRDGTATLRVTALSDDILRVQAVPAGSLPPGEPWAVLPEWRGQSLPVTAQADGFATATLQVRRDGGRLQISDTAGHVLMREAAADTTAGPTACQDSPPNARYFGLGDKPGPLDRRGHAFVNWNTDAYAWQESSDPLYKTVPFFITLQGGRAHGVFLDSTWRSHFDFGVARPDVICFGAEAGPLDWYFIAGPQPKQVLTNYTALTGRMALPPRWSLGFQQSRWSYTPQARVEAVVAAYRAQHIPLDAIWLDIGYQDHNRPFTVDTGAFPDLSGMVGRLRGQGVRTVAIADLHIADLPYEGYAPYDSGLAGRHFVRAADGSVYVGAVWPGPAVFPDFARAATRRWFGALYRRLYLTDGIAGFWDDMNEPVVFDGPAKTLPLDAIHRIEQPGLPPRLATHREIHNAYGMLNAAATAEGLRALAPDRRPFVLTRASFAGGQRDAAIWTGDNSSTWNHLRLSTPQLLSLGLSGFALAGDDIGGFRGTPSPALLTRWLEVGAFEPLFRDHTEAGTADQEAYVGDAGQVAIRRAAIAERYRLLPYIYTVAEEASRTGWPIMRPLFLEFPDAPRGQDHAFLLGPSLLVAPPPDERPDRYPLLLPPGSVWFDYWTGQRVAAEPVPALTPEAGRLPVYVRAGSIIARQAVTQSTAETPPGNLELRVYPGPDCAGSLYWDDGETLGYTRGEFLRQTFACTRATDGLHIDLHPRNGGFAPWWRRIDITVFGQPGASRVQVDGQAVAASFDPAANAVGFTIEDAPGGAQIVLAP